MDGGVVYYFPTPRCSSSSSSSKSHACLPLPDLFHISTASCIKMLQMAKWTCVKCSLHARGEASFFIHYGDGGERLDDAINVIMLANAPDHPLAGRRPGTNNCCRRPPLNGILLKAVTRHVRHRVPSNQSSSP